MTGEQFRGRGLTLAAVGIGLVAWVAVFAALAEVKNPRVLVAIAVSAGLVCLCAAVGGLVAMRIDGAEAAARLRHVFVVLEGAAMSIFYLFYWFAFGVEPVGSYLGFAFGTGLPLLAAVLVALVLVGRSSRAVHKVVVGASGPIVPDSGEGAPAQRIRVFGTVLVVVGVALSVAGVAVAFTTPALLLVLEVPGLLAMLMPVVLGVKLIRVTSVHSARRMNPGWYLAVPAGIGFAVGKLASVGGDVGVLFGALVFGAVVCLVVSLVVVREYTGAWDRAWQVSR